MPSFSYTTPMTNPYSSQKAPSGESLLKNLLRSRGAPTLAVVESLGELVVQQKMEWTFDMAKDFSSFVMSTFDSIDYSNKNTKLSDGCIATLTLLVNSLEQWPENELYAILVQREGKSLLKFIMSFIQTTEPSLHLAALVGIAAASRALSRLHQLTTLNSATVSDSAWWFTEETDIQQLAKLAVHTLSSDSSIHQQYLPNNEKVKLAATSILSQLLKHDSTSSIVQEFSEEKLKTLCLQLIREMQALDGAELPHTSSNLALPLAFNSASLLSLIQWKSTLGLSEFNRMIQTTTLVENVVQFVFPSSTNNRGGYAQQGPRWTWDGQYEDSLIHALDLIQCWNLCNSDAWSVFTKQEIHWRSFVETSWTSIFLDQSPEPDKILPKLFLLHTLRPLASKNILALVIQRLFAEKNGPPKPFQFLTSWLVKKTSHPSFVVNVYCTRLLWLFLSDRKSIGAHDDMSRSFWAALDTELLDKCLKLTLEHASTEEIHQPLLLALLDLLDAFFQVEENCNFALSRLGAQSLEKLIYLIKPMEVKYDFVLEDIEEGGDENTPPANNLSRLDETSICMELEDIKEPRGLDHNTRLAAATALSRLGYHSSLPSEESIGLLISRICTAVNDFLTSFQEKSQHVTTTLDVFKRSFRLQNLVATPEHEDFVATLLFTRHLHENQQLQSLKRENEYKQQKLAEASKREKQLQEDKQRLIQQYRSQSVILQRELIKTKHSATQDARQMVAIHVSERNSAESRAMKMEQRIQESESELQLAKRQAEELQQTTNQIKDELQVAKTKEVELKDTHEDACRQLREEVAKSNELEEKLSAKSEEIVSVRGRQSELEGEIDYFRNDNQHLLDNLEDLFADMVSIAQIYQHKENEESSISQKKNRDIEELHGNLSLERKKNRKMEESMESLKAENKKLFQKVAKYKERLEEERKDRQEEKQRRKRSGPVSYINQLHDTSRSSSRHDASQRSLRPLESQYNASSRSKSRSGKENSYYAYESQRRKHY